MLFKDGSRFGSKAGWTAVVVAGLVGTGLFLAGMRQWHSRGTAPTIAPTGKHATARERAQVAASYGNLPLSFEPNQGQTDPEVKFLSRSPRYDLFLTANEAVFTLPIGADRAAKAGEPAKNAREQSTAVLRMNLVGASSRAQIRGDGELAGISNYLVGNDSSRWRTNVPQFPRVVYQDIYPGIDLTFHGAQRQVEFDFVVDPGSSVKAIALSFDGAGNVKIDADGDLLLSSAAGDLRLQKPVAYQIASGSRVPINAKFVVDRNHVGFAVGRYDASQQLVIDPVLAYATYLGGTAEDEGEGIALDSAGNAYITGQTKSTAFPKTAGVVQGANGGGFDAFVTKLNPTLSSKIFSTYFGGSLDDNGTAIALLPGSATPDVFITGATQSSDFPGATGAQGTFGGGTLDAFAVRLNSTGTAIVYSTYIGGTDDDIGYSIAVDGAGEAFVGGGTRSTDFPVNPLGVVQPLFNGQVDAFITKLSADGTQFLYSTYLGGSNTDQVLGIAIDGASPPNAFVTGFTSSADFVTTTGVLQASCGVDGACDASSHAGTPQPDVFVTKISGDGKIRVWSTFLGGSEADSGFALAVDGSGNVYVTGGTKSSGFTTHAAGALGAADVFITKLKPDATGTLFSKTFGGTGDDLGLALAIDSNNVYISGQTKSADFPTSGAAQSNLSGASDAFVTVFSNAGNMGFSTFLGGGGDEDHIQNAGIAVDSQGNIYVTGDTAGTFPVQNGALQNSYQGGLSDAFVAKYLVQAPTANFTVAVDTVSPSTITRGSSGTGNLTVTSTNGFTGLVTLTCGVAPAMSKPPACSVTQPAALTANGTQSATVTVKTVATGAVNPAPSALWLPFSGALLMGACFLTGAASRRRLATILFGSLAFVGLLVMLACGSGNGGGGGGGGGGGTTAGAYTVTVTGNVNGATASSSAAAFTVQ